MFNAFNHFQKIKKIIDYLPIYCDKRQVRSTNTTTVLLLGNTIFYYRNNEKATLNFIWRLFYFSAGRFQRNFFLIKMAVSHKCHLWTQECAEGSFNRAFQKWENEMCTLHSQQDHKRSRAFYITGLVMRSLNVGSVSVSRRLKAD